MRCKGATHPKLGTEPPASRTNQQMAVECTLPSSLESLLHGAVIRNRAVGPRGAQFSRSPHDGERSAVHERRPARRRAHDDSGFFWSPLSRLVRAGLPGQRVHVLRQGWTPRGSYRRESTSAQGFRNHESRADFSDVPHSGGRDRGLHQRWVRVEFGSALN